MAGFLMVLFKAPFMVILLTVVMLQAGAELTALIVLAVAAVMIVQPYILAAIAARQAARAAREARGPASPIRAPAVSADPVRRPRRCRARPKSIRKSTTKLTNSVRPNAIIAT